MHSKNLINNGLKIFAFSTLIFSMEFLIPSNFDSISFVKSHHAHAQSSSKWNFVNNWDVEISGVDLAGNVYRNLFTRGKVYMKKSGKSELIKYTYSCLVVENYNKDDGQIFISFFKRKGPAILQKDIFNCYNKLKIPRPISEKSDLSFAFEKDVKLFDTESKKIHTFHYGNIMNRLVISDEQRKDFIALLKNNINESIFLSFPVNSDDEIDNIMVEFGPNNLNDLLAKTE